MEIGSVWRTFHVQCVRAPYRGDRDPKIDLAWLMPIVLAVAVHGYGWGPAGHGNSDCGRTLVHHSSWVTTQRRHLVLDESMVGLHEGQRRGEG